jgi:hypothetical protein
MITRFIHRALGQLERIAWDTSGRPLKYAPIFIIGPPRSGSTLLYQCLLERFRIGYFSNLHNKFYANPALLERVLRVSRWPHRASYHSKHGYTRGCNGPSESWSYWYRFFRRNPQYVGLEDVSPVRLAELRGSMRSLGNAFNRPILIKNLPCTLRLFPIHEALPEAIYLVMQRGWVSMGRSILTSRKQVHGSYDKWWSVEPPGFEELAARPPHEQVVEQIRSIYSIIDDARVKIGCNRFLDVSYEAFCIDTHSVLTTIADFAAEHSIPLAVRKEVPPQFPLPTGPDLEPDLLKELKGYARLRQC